MGSMHNATTDPVVDPDAVTDKAEDRKSVV